MGGDGSGGRNGALLLLGCGRGWIEDYLVELSNRGLRAVTINRKIYSLNSFFEWARVRCFLFFVYYIEDDRLPAQSERAHFSEN
jgi:hypothetical protein